MKSFTSKFLMFFVALLFVFQEIELAVTSNTAILRLKVALMSSTLMERAE